MTNIFGRKQVNLEGIDKRLSDLEVLIANSESLTKEAKQDLMEEMKSLLEIKGLKTSIKVEEKSVGIKSVDIMNGLLGLVAIAMTLEYEKENIVTTKAFGIAQKMIGK